MLKPPEVYRCSKNNYTRGGRYAQQCSYGHRPLETDKCNSQRRWWRTSSQWMICERTTHKHIDTVTFWLGSKDCKLLDLLVSVNTIDILDSQSIRPEFTSWLRNKSKSGYLTKISYPSSHFISRWGCMASLIHFFLDHVNWGHVCWCKLQGRPLYLLPCSWFTYFFAMWWFLARSLLQLLTLGLCFKQSAELWWLSPTDSFKLCLTLLLCRW